MTYTGFPLTGIYTHDRRHRTSDKDAVRKITYNLLAVFAFMTAAAFIVFAYHPNDGTVSNPRFESMGISHVPTTFRGAPPTR